MRIYVASTVSMEPTSVRFNPSRMRRETYNGDYSWIGSAAILACNQRVPLVMALYSCWRQQHGR